MISARTSSSSIPGQTRAMERIPYDEFGFFHENAAEFGLPWAGPPAVRRGAGDARPRGRAAAAGGGNRGAHAVLLHPAAPNAPPLGPAPPAPPPPPVAVYP